MNHSPEEQLRELIRQTIREELKSREVKTDPETGITSFDLEDEKGERVGFLRRKELPSGRFVVGGRMGPKAAQQKVDEAEDTKSNKDKPNQDTGEKKPKRRKEKRSIEDIAREMGQIEMFPEQKHTIDEWIGLMHEYGVFDEAKFLLLGRKEKSAPRSTGRMASDVTEETTPTSDDKPNEYNKDAVEKAIQASNRAGRKIGKSEANKIHRLLQGWRGNPKK